MFLITLVAVPISLFVIMRTPFVQTFMARTVAGYFSEKLDTKITIGSFFLDFDLALNIQKLHVSDRHDSTLLEAEELSVAILPWKINEGLHIKSFMLKNFEARLMQYKGEANLNYEFIVDHFITRKGDTLASATYPLFFRQLKLENGAFRYTIEDKANDSILEMDYSNIVVKDIFLEMVDVSVFNDSIEADIQMMKAIERSGLNIQMLKGKVSIHSGGLFVDRLKLITPRSSVQMQLSFTYNGYAAYLDFIDSVRITADVQPSAFYLADVGYFAPVMFEMPNLIAFSGKFDGTVSDFSTQAMSFSFGDQTTFKGDLKMKGLPDFFTSDIVLNVDRLQTEITDIEQFAIPIEGRYLQLPLQLEPLGRIYLEGVFRGSYTDFSTRVLANTDVGRLASDLTFRTNPITGIPRYNLTLNTKSLALGKLLDQTEVLGNISMSAQIDGSGVDLDEVQATAQANIQSMGLMGNSLNKIPVKASLNNGNISAEFSIQDDRRINIEFQGTADLSEKQPVYTIHSKIGYAHLSALHLVNNDSVAKLSTEIDAEFSGLSLDDFLGNVQFRNLTFVNEQGALMLQNFELDLIEDAYLGRKCNITSDILDFEMGGIFKWSALEASFSRFLNHYVAFNFLQSSLPSLDSSFLQDFYFNLKFKNPKAIMHFLAPAIAIAPNTNFSGVLTQKSQVLNTTFRSDWIRFGEVQMEMPYLLMRSDMQRLNMSLEMADLIFKKAVSSDSIDFGIEKPRLSLEANKDNISFQLLWDNQRKKMLNKGLVKGNYWLTDDKIGHVNLDFADVVINDSVVKLSPENHIYFEKAVTRIEKFTFQMGKSSLGLEGTLPLREQDSLVAVFDNWDVSAFDVITGTVGFDLDGVINGDLVLANVLNNPYFASNLHITSLGLNKEKLGDARLLSNWSNTDESIYANMQIINAGNTGASRMLNLRGFYYPNRKKNNIAMDLSLENFRLRVLNQFMVGIISKLEGFASGDFTIKGELLKPVVEGQLSFARTSFLIDYLNVKYSLQHALEIKPGLIPVNNLILFDTAGRKAVVNGTISHNHLLDWAFNIRIQPETLLALNTGPKQNELFYGSAVATGEVLIKGPLDNIEMGMKVISQKGTSIVIPLNTAGTVGSSDFIRFVNLHDNNKLDSLMMGPFLAPIANTGFSINLETEITPDAFVKIFLPYDMGSLEARGAGNLTLEVNNAGNFALNGDYFVNNGLFTFTFENILKKRFNLMEGGRITWTGDPMEADIDVKGVYRVKASLAGLGIDTTSSLRNRINVDCIIHLTNQLFNPDIRFSFALPGSDTDVEQRVFNVIDTTNDAAMTQQMVSLLVLGGFANTNIGNSSITNSTFEMLSGQLSGLLSQISKDFDIGLNYRPGDELTNEELEVALSTQLFNDRVSIEGNFGVSNNKGVNQNASNIVGDVDVSVKLTEDGRFRMKGFNHSNHSSWLNFGIFDNYSPYTQGIGVSYRQEFDAFNELFYRKKKKTKNTPP